MPSNDDLPTNVSDLSPQQREALEERWEYLANPSRKGLRGSDPHLHQVFEEAAAADGLDHNREDYIREHAGWRTERMGGTNMANTLLLESVYQLGMTFGQEVRSRGSKDALLQDRLNHVHAFLAPRPGSGYTPGAARAHRPSDPAPEYSPTPPPGHSAEQPPPPPYRGQQNVPGPPARPSSQGRGR
ncbi:hypothetical protein [Streptomyces axinellae]|uniref:Uncharacterized protein n=1 Tax=Streptomyces axinellae TaxID=552788 RepID=A0ABN3QED8_9ACTN